MANKAPAGSRRADGRAQEHGQQAAHQSDEQRFPGAVDQLSEDVIAQCVGSQ